MYRQAASERGPEPGLAKVIQRATAMFCSNPRAVKNQVLLWIHGEEDEAGSSTV